MCTARRAVWHSGFMDAADAEKIASDIRIVSSRLKELRKSLLMTETELRILKKKYEEVSGERYEDDSAKERQD